MTMIQQTFFYAVALIVLGVGSYFYSDQASKTALIPAFIGAVVLVLGLVGTKVSLRKHAMHGALLVAVIGLFGAARGLPGLVTMISGGEVERPLAVVSQTVMFVLSLSFLLAGMRSFSAARRARSE